MIDRMFYKTRAKVNLKGKWLAAALVALVLLIVNGQNSIRFNTGRSNMPRDPFFGNDMMNQAADYAPMVPFQGYYGMMERTIFPIMGFVLPVILLAAALGIAFHAFLLGPLSLGAYQYFRRNDLGEERFDMQSFLWAFRSPHYMNIVRILFVRSVKIFLWSLLFVIPGIIKAYEYRMIPYILTRNPEIGADEAFHQTRELTMGRKGSLFMLDLSFIGWYILGAIPFGLGTPFVKAYETQTSAGLFNDWVGDTSPESQPAW